MMNKRLSLVHKLWITLAFSISCCCTAFAQLSGTRTIGGTVNDYPTIAAAIADLNTQGVGPAGIRFLVSAGHTETSSNLLITATGTEADSVIFEKSGAGANPVITAAPGTGFLDGIIKLKGADYITFDGIDLVDPVSNVSDTSRMEWGFALLKADTNGSRNVTIKNCHITLQKTYRFSVGVYAANHNDSSDTEILFGSASSTPNSYLQIFNNTISDVYNGIVLKSAIHLGSYPDEHDSIAGNTFTNFGGGADSARAVYAFGQSHIQIVYNSISGGNGTTGVLQGIMLLQGSNTSVTISHNTISLTGSGLVTAIHNSTGSLTGRVEIAYNTISNCSATNNFSGVFDNSSTPAISIHHNTISQISFSGFSVNFSGINFQSFNSVIASSFIYRNTISDITTSSTYGDMIGVRSQAVGVMIDSNLVSNFVTLSGNNSNCYGILHYANLYSDEVLCRQNIVHDLNAQYAFSTGINVTGRLVTISSNEIYNLFSSSRVIGISNGYTNMGVNVLRNKIHDLECYGQGSDFGDGLASAVVAISISLSNPVGISYNLISGLRSYNTQSGNDITAITIDGNTVMDIAYNTIYMDARANPDSYIFGTSVLWHWRGPLSLRNNIFVNTSDARGGGKSVVLRGYEGTTYSLYQDVSNNNLLHAGTPSPEHLIYFDFVRSFQQVHQFKTWVGPKRDSLSFSEMPHFLDTSASSPNYLKIDTLTPTQIESGAQDILIWQGDYLSDTARASLHYPLAGQLRTGGWAPDIGAFEGDYTPADSMVYVSSNTVQLTGDAYRNIPRQGVIGAMIVTSGVRKALAATSFTFDLGLSNNIPTLSKARLYYTASSDQFDTTGFFGSYDSLSGQFTINGTQLLISADTNYFWLTYNVSADALPGDRIDASFLSFTVGGVMQIPAVTNPAGEKMIPAALAGTYKVGTAPGTDYQTITAAVRDLNQKGIAAPVEFLLTDADYSGEAFPIVINSTVGISATDTVVIKPDTGVNVNIYTYASAVFVLNGADHITFDGSNNNTDSRNFSITNYGGTTIWGRRDEYGDSCMFNTFKNLSIEASPYGIIFADGTASPSSTGRGHHYNRVEHCRFTSAQTSIAFTGDFNKAKGNVITGNDISSGGIVVSLQDSVIITHNKLSNITNSFYGISLGITSMNNYAPNGAEVINARVSENEVGPLTSNASAAGIVVAFATKGTNVISNNLVHDIKGNGTGNRPTAGIFVRGGDSAATTQIYYNTVLMQGTSTRSTPSCYAIAIADNNPNADLRNNIFYNVQTALGTTSNTYAIGFGSSNFTRLRCNNNLYYTSGANAKFAVTGGLGNSTIGTIRADLAALQAATQHDTNSVAVNPAFDSLTLYDPTVLPAIRGGAPIAGFDTDMNGIIRDPAAPTLGALEQIPVYDDIGVKAVYKDPLGLRVLIKNFGLTNISGLTLTYEIGATQVTNVYSVSIPPYDTTSVYVSPFVIPNGVNLLKVSTSLPNGTTDTKAANDTFAMLISYPLAGVYTIGGTAPDYASFTEAAYELVQRGVSADVTFLVRSGVYNEQMGLTAFPNGSPGYRVTFVSEVANRDSVTLEYAATDITDNYVLKLENVENISFRHITFRATGPTYAASVYLYGYCSADTFDQCNFQSNAAGVNQYYKTLLGGDELQGSELVISNSSFSGGRSGIDLYGKLDQTFGLLPLNGLTIEGNSFSNLVFYGCMVNRVPNARIRNNDVNMSSQNAFSGITCSFCDSAMEITGNYLRNLTTGYGIHIQAGKGTGLGGVVANNVISMTNGTGLMMSTTGGWDDGPYNMRVYHNSVHVSSTNGHAAYFDVDNATWYYETPTGIEVKNNVFSNTATDGIAVRIPLTNSASPFINTDYNNFYSEGVNLIRRAVSTNYVHDLFYEDLAGWEAVNFVDRHSTAYRPGYANTDLVPDPSDSASWSLNGRGIHLDTAYRPFIGTDKLGNIRPMTRPEGVPDIGAYEFTPTSLPPVARQIGVIAPDSTTLFLSVFSPKDTIIKLKWDNFSTVPDYLTVRQYTGESPVGRTGMPNYMYFSTGIEDQGIGSYQYEADLYYKDQWLGTTPSETGNGLTTFQNVWTLPSGTVDPDRNIIHATAQSIFGILTGTDMINPLPVQLLSLTAKRSKEDVILNWITASEFNSSHFEIERSVNGKTFTGAGSVNANGNSSRALQYRFTDINAPLVHTVYYRLKMVDKDGSFRYSNIVSVALEKVAAINEITVFPNPFKESVYIKTSAAAAGRIKITLMDLSGRVVDTQQADVEEGVSMIALNAADKLQSGVYFIRTDINGTVHTQKLVKQ